jgi:membrane-bound ClpP family serine protease
LIGTPPVPVATWIGPAPAGASGGAFLIFYAADNRAIAPGSQIGPTNPVVLGEDREFVISPLQPISAEQTNFELQPTLRQYLQALDGRTFTTTSGEVTGSTRESLAGGVTVKQVTFKKPGLVTRFFRLAVNPEAAFFFLVVGLSIVTFEFFALGPGVAAGVASISLLLGGWGIVTLPVRWWALGLALVGWWALTAAHQKGGILLFSLAGAIALQIGGTFFVYGNGQIDPRWWLVLPSVLAALFFFLLAMPTVQRARLSTQTIGHESLIGRTGLALIVFDPNGTVEVNGAKWRATAHREAGIVEGSEIIVTGVDGLFLEVERSDADRET